MNIKSIRSRLLILPPLFHISFNSKLEGEWDPEFNQKEDENHPAVPDPAKEAFYPEPNIGRISVAPTIEGCFVGVFPNVSKFFEEKKYPHMNFFVYSPEFAGGERVVTPETLTKDRLVWDAHVTKEYLILDKVEMRLVGELEVKNTNKSPTAYTHPFDDKQEPVASVGPEHIRFKWIDLSKEGIYAKRILVSK